MNDGALIRELENVLITELEAEVRFDEMTRVLYSTDASNFQIEPVGVVIPKSADDLIGTVEIAKRFNTAVLARGGGTSLAGQAVGHAVVIDCSKYLNKVIAVDAESKKVRAEPGIYLQQLNGSLAGYGLMFGPDPSTAMIATVGGVVGNNATGAHSILYGMAGDHVESCRLVTADGSLVELGEKYTGGLTDKLTELRDKYAGVIEQGFPRHWRRASGYSLNYLLDHRFNPAKLLAGSEGTLGIASEFTLNLVPAPKHTGLVILQFTEISSAMDAVAEILEIEPSAVELIDKMLIGLTRRHSGFASLLGFIHGDPAAVLIVEFYGGTEKEAESKCRDLKTYLIDKKINCDIKFAISEADQSRVWQVRRAGLGLLMSRRDEYKPIPCIEDVSVPVHKLSEYVRDIMDLIKKLGTEAAFYGHASAGCLHIRPLVNLKTENGIKIMEELTEQALGLAIKYGGVLSGEHGDGLQRSHLNEKLFGHELYRAMQELKTAFDPDGIFNPGKVVDSAYDRNTLRYGENYKTYKLNTHLDWTRDNGFTGAVEMCNGQGVCRKLGEGIMCPSYIATRDEKHTTRARANALRAVISGSLPKQYLTTKQMYDVFDLCISCKACKSECPSAVDVAKMKIEFLAHYGSVHGLSYRDRVFGYIHELSRYGSHLPSLVNFFSDNAVFRWISSGLGITSNRPLPRLYKETFMDWFQNRPRYSDANNRQKVVYFHDTWVSYYDPQVGKSAVRLLEASGFEVVLIPNRHCCGRPLLSNGMVEAARKCAKHNVSVLSRYVRDGISVVGTEPSCILTLRDEYPDLLPGNKDAGALAENSFLLEEFIYESIQKRQCKISWKNSGPEIFFHDHCHSRSQGFNNSAVKLLEQAGCEVTTSGAGCCGMAGSFGYEAEHYDVSKSIGEDRLFPAVRLSKKDTVISVTGFSCSHQIEHFTGRKTKHIAEVLAGQIES